MIYLVTGSNGTGKTLFTLRWTRDMQLEWKKKHGIDRPVFYDGFDIDPKTAEEFNWKPCDPTKWVDLPDNSIVIVDEAQRIFPLRGASASVPEFESEIAISHRKRGFDFFIITQHPSNISAFLRRLVGSGWHRHLKRLFGFDVVSCSTYNYAETTCEKPTSASKAQEIKKLKFPKEVYSWYKSAELHTAKKQLPKGVYVLFLLLIGLFICLFLLASIFEKKITPATSDVVTNEVLPRSRNAPESSATTNMSPQEYINSHTPRIKGFPHTASRYDEVTKPVTAPYPAACISSQSQGCKCFTQQGTRITMEEKTCENIVREGYFIDWDTNPNSKKEQL